MAGKRLIDAALVFNATRNIFKQHLRIRSEQFDVWSKTSSIAKATKAQTDRVTLTVQAANALAKRFNDNIPSSADVFDTQQRSSDKDAISQEHSIVNDPPVSPEESQESKPHLRSLDSAAVGSDASEASSRKPFESANERKEIPQKVSIPEQENVTEGINTDVFHSPRVAKVLGGRTIDPKLGLRAAKQGPIDRTVLSAGIDQETVHVRDSKQRLPSGRLEMDDFDGKVSRTSNTLTGSNDKSKPQSHSSDQAVRETQHTTSTSQEADPDVQKLATELSEDADDKLSGATEAGASAQHELRESRVPSSRVGRLWEYSGLATSMAFGAVGETFRRMTGSTSPQGSLMLSAGNMERLVAKLSKMRGAALKLGQMMSFQDSKMLPEPVVQVLQRVQDNADYMPAFQRNKVLSSNLGSDWRDLFSSFEEKPFAAASIGQVHKGVLAADGTSVAIKIQYPGVAQSISSDLNNLSILLTASRLLPKGLFLDKTIENARTELAWECDYKREAECQERFSSLLSSSEEDRRVFAVPKIVSAASGPQVITAELMHGTAVSKASLNLNQAERDWIGTQILRLCLKEITEFKFMQTDPNWTNFLYNRASGKLELLDFGAARDFPTEFIHPYVRNLAAAARGDREEVARLSVELGYLTGHESKAMRDAHVQSVLTLAEPFSSSSSQTNHERRNVEVESEQGRQVTGEGAVYDFRNQTITDRVRDLIPVMVRERLAPPPEETYSLHRKLSGAFLLLARLGSRVHCRELFVASLTKWDPSIKL